MKIELTDVDQILKTHDVEFARVTDMSECQNGSTIITVYNKGDIKPTLIHVRESIQDINTLVKKKTESLINNGYDGLSCWDLLVKVMLEED